MRHELANGTVSEIGTSGANIAVDIDYTEANGSHSNASYTGSVTCDTNGKAISVFWSNNSKIERIQ